MAKQDYFLLLKRLGFALALLVLSRLGFYFYNYDYFQAASVSETFLAFLVGLRFDIATALIANLFFILLSIFPLRFTGKEGFLKGLFVAGNVVCLGLIVGDYEFFGFNGKKLTYDMFLTANDIQEQSFQLIFNYWPLSLIVIAAGASLWRFYPVYNGTKKSGESLGPAKSISLSLLAFVMTGIGVRGGLQMRSLSPKEAFVFKSYELGNFALNSAYSLVRSFGKKGAPPARYFASDREAADKVVANRDFAQGPWGYPGQNVVLIIVESLSQEYVERGFAPFVSSLAKKGLSFERNFANGRRSIEVLPSIMASFPSVVGRPLYQSQYQSNRFHPLPRILKENGYHSAFFHGGKRGTMDFDAYCLSIGFDEYNALEDYPDQTKFDGHWGVYDHHYLEYFAGKLGEYKEPFFGAVFTLSSHQPYSLPHGFEDRFPKGDQPIHESIGYADFALKTFFEKAKDQPWFKNTLFVITADHTQKMTDKNYHTVLGRYRVPLIFYHPSVNLKKDPAKNITQHVDIMPSILDFLNIEYKPRLYYGASVFNADEGRMFNFISGNYFLLKGRSMVSFDGQTPRTYVVGQNYLVPKTTERSNEELLEELKALIQYTNNGLRNNNIYTLRP